MSTAARVQTTPSDAASAAWASHAPALAAWTDKRLVNRRDAFGRYIAVEHRHDPDLSALTAKEPLTLAVLTRHFRGVSTGDLIGLHSTARDEPTGPGEVPACWSRFGVLDIDLHGDGDPEATWRAALAWHRKLVGLGFQCLLLDSNGKGGYHLFVVFDAPTPTADVFHFLKWLSVDWERYGLKTSPETFPKQASIGPEKFGNWIRLPGRHHTREHFTKVWSGKAWLEGSAAVKAIVSTQGDPASFMPAEAIIPPKPKRMPSPRRTKAADDASRDVKLAEEALAFIRDIDDYDTWIEVGQSLAALGSEGLNLWINWSSGGQKFQEGDCERKWRTFTPDGGRTLGTIFYKAKDGGYPGQGRATPKAAKARVQPLRVHSSEDAPADPPPPKDGGGSAAPDSRPAIEITTERHLALEATIKALAADPDLFVRGDSLVTVIDESAGVAKLPGGVELRNAKGSPRVVTIDEAYIGCHVTKFAMYYEWRKDKSGEEVARDCHPPAWLIAGIANRKHWGPGIRRLDGVADVPFIRADGSIFTGPGYDKQTATLLRSSITLPTLPVAPKREDAYAAACRILGYVKQFPFATLDDEAVWLAAVVNAAARPAISGPTPGTAINGNRAACGKGLLIDILGRIVWGDDVPTTTYPVDPIEAQKVKVAIALSAKPVVSFDNLEEGHSYGNPALDSAITSTVIDDRILGTAKNTGRLPLRPCWLLNGNNLTPGKDAHRRWLVCNLFSDLERPEERGDLEVRDLRKHVMAHRGELVRDVLTILKAHANAGYPTDSWAPLASFEDWDRVVRGAVWYATGRDCCRTLRKAAEEAPERLEKLALLEAWAAINDGETTGCTGVTVEKARALADVVETKHPDLRDAFMRRSRDGKMPSVRQIGNFIRGMKGANIGGLRFLKAGDKQRSALWMVAGTSTSSK